MTVFKNEYLRIKYYKAERALLLIKMVTMENKSPPDVYGNVGKCNADALLVRRDSSAASLKKNGVLWKVKVILLIWSNCSTSMCKHKELEAQSQWVSVSSSSQKRHSQPEDQSNARVQQWINEQNILCIKTEILI